MTPKDLLKKMEAGEQTTLPVLLKALDDHLDEFYAVWSEGRDKRSVLTESLKRYGKERRDAAIEMLKSAIEDEEARDKEFTNFLYEISSNSEGARFFQYTLPLMAAYLRSDEPVQTIIDEFGIDNRRWEYRSPEDHLCYFHPLYHGMLWAIEEKGKGVSTKERLKFYEIITCGEVWEKVCLAVLSIASEDYYGDYLEELGLFGLPVVDENGVDPTRCYKSRG